MHSQPNREKMNPESGANLRKGMSGKIFTTHNCFKTKQNNSKDCTLRSHRKGK